MSENAYALYKEKFLVFSSDGAGITDTLLENNYKVVLWKPSLKKFLPPGLGWKFSLWWLAHMVRVFRNRNYSVLYIYHNDEIIHRSCLVPPYFRWPFMQSNDLLISSTWTDPRYRGHGFATIGLIKAIYLMNSTSCRFWYVTRNNNPASIAVCKKAGFILVGYARRTNWMGVRLLGHFVIKNDNLKK